MPGAFGEEPGGAWSRPVFSFSPVPVVRALHRDPGLQTQASFLPSRAVLTSGLRQPPRAIAQLEQGEQGRRGAGWCRTGYRGGRGVAGGARVGTSVIANTLFQQHKRRLYTHLAKTLEPRGFPRVAAGFSSYDGDLRLPLGLALGSPIFPSSERESWG